MRAGGVVDEAAVVERMSFRRAQGQMPPVASEQLDTAGLAEVRALVSTWAAVDAGTALVLGGIDAGAN